ncbi:MAG: type IV toxin-antitoxin system AbiEi family antitoxin domain-containing protein [Planctomycetota bacterium]
MVDRALKPDWNRLYEFAASQEGHFTSAQAGDAGYSPQLLQKHLKGGRIRRLGRGIYRVVHYPAGDHEDLVAAWLWSGHSGVFSHETALALHELSDAMPTAIHMTVPARWAGRRLRVPQGLLLHHADIAEKERGWVGSVRATTVPRTLVDCAASSVEPRLVLQAFEDALARGLVDRGSIPAVVAYLNGFFPASRPARVRRSSP